MNFGKRSSCFQIWYHKTRMNLLSCILLKLFVIWYCCLNLESAYAALVPATSAPIKILKDSETSNSTKSPLRRNENVNSPSVKKDLNVVPGGPDIEEPKMKVVAPSNEQHRTNWRYVGPDLDNISGFTQAALVIFIVSLILVVFIMYRICKLKQSRAANRYGTPTTYHELTPIAIEDDESETEEQTLFDLQRSRSQAVL